MVKFLRRNFYGPRFILETLKSSGKNLFSVCGLGSDNFLFEFNYTELYADFIPRARSSFKFFMFLFSGFH